VTALNEERHIRDAVREAKTAIGDKFAAWELLLFDDGSTDRTGAIMDELAAEDPDHVKVVHHDRPRNVGAVYREGIALARSEYVTIIPGDNENPSCSLEPAFAAIGRADVVVPYVERTKKRSFARNAVSRSYVRLLNGLFGLGLRYYNGTVVHRTDLVRRVTITTDSFAFQAEALVKVLRAGASFVEVAVEVDPKPERETKAFRVKNVYGVVAGVTALAWNVHVAKGAAR
jgi:glycosyltransferase involved in cell wall biosynthesis